MKRRLFILAAFAALSSGASASPVLFDFDSSPKYTPLPIEVTVGGITAHLSATGEGFSVQAADTLGFTPAGFGGNCIYPSSVFQADLIISFSTQLSDFSIMFSTEEYGSDSAATMRATGFRNGVNVGTNTAMAPNPGTWPVGTLTLSSATAFDKVVVHYDKPPVNGENWGPVFLADNMTVTAVPEPASLAVLAIGLAALIHLRRSHHS